MYEKAFITGGSGLLGLNFILQNIKKIRFTSVENNRTIPFPHINSISCQLENPFSIKSTLKSYSPNFVINSAGMTNVEECEKYPDKANFINGTIAGNIAKATYENDIKFIHISTDHLFDGNQSFMKEKDQPNPINSYGYSKALGEKLVLKNNPNALIIRCNFFGWGPSYRESFSDFIIKNIESKNKIKLAHDYYYTPLSTKELIDYIMLLIDGNARGIYNVVGSQRISKYEFGLKVAEIFSLDHSYINKVSLKSLGIGTSRPSDLSLCNKKLHNFIGSNIGIIDKSVKELKEQMNTSLFKKIKTI